MAAEANTVEGDAGELWVHNNGAGWGGIAAGWGTNAAGWGTGAAGWGDAAESPVVEEPFFLPPGASSGLIS